MRPQPGAVELTEVSMGGQAWWSVGFEASAVEPRSPRQLDSRRHNSPTEG